MHTHPPPKISLAKADRSRRIGFATPHPMVLPEEERVSLFMATTRTHNLITQPNLIPNIKLAHSVPVQGNTSPQALGHSMHDGQSGQGRPCHPCALDIFSRRMKVSDFKLHT